MYIIENASLCLWPALPRYKIKHYIVGGDYILEKRFQWTVTMIFV